ncbi:hypothetical protein [Aeromicrobium sp. REDSEA-S32_B7]|jgi:hypothetical protein|uniref:hypothetical protein n=1 Tax=Aeromicrobium sp. REDSEA-S32_B7 TaxID=1811526 RepID=UPI000B0A2B1C|nr:hypothetical protein [Aeromicrobium sp. REDSEA-S32_B7]
MDNETNARNLLWWSFGFAVLLNLIASVADLQGSVWFALRAVVAGVFTVALGWWIFERVRHR